MSGFENIVKLSKKNLKPKKEKKLPYQVPKWFKSLKQGSHGSTINQKKAWTVVSEYVRKRDFALYRGFCVDGCGTRLNSWKEGQAGHFKAYGACNGIFKYELKNLALQAPNCNRRSDGVVGHGFAKELKRRHGEDILKWIEIENQKHRGEKIEDWVLVEMCEKLLKQKIL